MLLISSFPKEKYKSICIFCKEAEETQWETTARNSVISISQFQPVHVDISMLAGRTRKGGARLETKQKAQSSDKKIPGKHLECSSAAGLTHGGSSVVGKLCLTAFSLCSRYAKARFIL